MLSTVKMASDNINRFATYLIIGLFHPNFARVASSNTLLSFTFIGLFIGQGHYTDQAKNSTSKNYLLLVQEKRLQSGTRASLLFTSTLYIPYFIATLLETNNLSLNEEV